MFLISFYEARGAKMKKEIDVQLIKALAGGHVMTEKAEALFRLDFDPSEEVQLFLLECQ